MIFPHVHGKRTNICRSAVPSSLEAKGCDEIAGLHRTTEGLVGGRVLEDVASCEMCFRIGSAGRPALSNRRHEILIGCSWIQPSGIVYISLYS